MARTEEQQEPDEFIAGYHGIPSAAELRKMSFVQLAEEFASCQKATPKFLVVEREIKKRLAKDQARINLPNMLWAAFIGGAFALAGAFVGAIIRGLPVPNQEIPASATVQNAEKSLSVIIKPPVRPSKEPAPRQNISEPSKGMP